MHRCRLLSIPFDIFLSSCVSFETEPKSHLTTYMKHIHHGKHILKCLAYEFIWVVLRALGLMIPKGTITQGCRDSSAGEGACRPA